MASGSLSVAAIATGPRWSAAVAPLPWPFPCPSLSPSPHPSLALSPSRGDALSGRPPAVNATWRDGDGGREEDDALRAGVAIVVVDAPPFVKSAEPMPMMRLNAGLIKPGDAGRIISRKPKNVWAVRFPTGAFLIDRKYFKLLRV